MHWKTRRTLALNRISRIVLAAFVVLIALFLVARLRYEGRAPVKLQAENCDRELWKHIGEKEKLHVVEECTAVEGRVAAWSRAVDGDLYIELDPEQKSVLNLFNVMNGRGNLAVEVICEHAPSNTADQAACGTFHSQITIPKVGDRVRVTGAYVTDRHYGWREVHPVTSIEILR